LGMVLKDDVVLAISKSGETAELVHLLPAFRRLDIPMIAMTGNPQSTLARYSAVRLDISVKEEACPNDLAPTASTTATLVMGDALAVALLEKHGFTREDFALFHPGGSLGKKLLVTVDNLMETGEGMAFCSPEETMKTVTIEMAHKRGICPIVDNAMRVLGVVTTGDLNRLVEQTEKFFKFKAEEVMNRNPKCIESGTLAAVALKKMEETRIIAMPVVDTDKKLIGIVHLHDILTAGIQS